MKPILERHFDGGIWGYGIQKIYRFDNGYGASVVRTKYSYGHERGLWELAVIHFESEHSFKFDLAYNTPITNDVLGYLKEEEIEPILLKIKSLNKYGQFEEGVNQNAET